VVEIVNPQYMARVRIGLLLVLAVLIQTTLGSDLRVLQVAPDLMVLMAVCGGLAGGPEAGAWVGFWSGLLADMFLTTPIGLSALTYCLIGAAVGALRESFLQEHRLLIPVVAFFATAAAVLLFVGLGDLLGQNQLLAGGRSWLIRVALIEASWNAVLAIPVSMIYNRAARGSVGVDRLSGAGAARATAKADRLALK
jgi:rod shape-determining protein MreD